MTNGFADGKKLQELFLKLNPFDSDLCLKPERDRATVLAANVNFPFEVELAAFMEAASLDGGSPLLVQVSGAALTVAGRGLRASKEPPPDKSQRLLALRLGARLLRDIADAYMEMYRPPLVGLGLDHFAVPSVRDVLFRDNEPSQPAQDARSIKEIRDRLTEAVHSARASGVPEPSREDIAAWETYLSSDEYREALEGFVTAIRELKPAWAMIDTENLPPVLNFAVTREFADAVDSLDPDIMLEAEYGATGKAGDRQGYVPLEGPKLATFARQVAGFVKYTGARGISYPIGMEHAVPSGVRHEPDAVRLEETQRAILKATGRYTPFAQHGGTGAKRVVRGLVGKNNVNTHFLVVGARCLAAYVNRNADDIAKGRKSVSGPVMHIAAGRAIMEAAVAKMKECGTYGMYATL
ncbi:MAG: class II fructose-bisphosphate aldolase [Bacillota bacterium]